MKIPIDWLKDYILVSQKAEKLADGLTMSGTAIEGVEKVGSTSVLVAEITTNRPDCLSLTGIAKEISALTSKAVKEPKTTKLKTLSKNSLSLKVGIENKKDCPAYTARVFDNVNTSFSPQWLLDRISWMGLRAINNIVDITNFCLFEIGQPLHAFDYDKVKGGEIKVRRAKKGETIVGIDEKKYELDPGILVIADAEKPIAIAGVMGGKEAEITSGTKRIILESARFDSSLVRRAGRNLKISTDSSYRFERSVDPEKMLLCSLRASNLIQELSGAEVASNLIHVGEKKSSKSSFITLRKEKLDERCGMNVPFQKAYQILKSLGLNVKKESSTKLKVQTSTLRADLTQEADLIEEVIRIYGYDKIPVEIPITKHTFEDGNRLNEYEVIRSIKSSLVSQGFWEAVSFSLLSKDSIFNKSKFGDENQILKIKNPLSQEQECLRPWGLNGLLNTVSYNVNRKEPNLSFFEIGKRFVGNKEETILSLATTGTFHQSWNETQEASIYHLKGVVENIFSVLEKETPEWNNSENNSSTFLPHVSIKRNSNEFGFCCEVREDILNEWDIPQKVYYAEVVLEEAFKLNDIVKKYEEPPKYPPVNRDIAFLIDQKILVSEIKNKIKKAAGPALTYIQLFDQYKGKNIPKDKRSLAFSLQYQKPDGTFTDQEITSLHQGIVDSLKESYQIELRQ